MVGGSSSKEHPEVMALVVFALVIWIEIYFGRNGRSLVVSLELMDKSKGSSWNVVWWSLTDLLDSGIGSFLLRSIGVPVGMLVHWSGCWFHWSVLQ